MEKSFNLTSAQITLNNLKEKIQSGDDSLETKERYLKLLNDIETYKKNLNTISKEVTLNKTYRLENVETHYDIQNKKNSWWKSQFGNFKLKITDTTETTLEDIEQNRYTNKLPQNTDKKEQLYPVIKLKIYTDDLLMEDESKLYMLNTYFTYNKIAWIYNTYRDKLILCNKVDIKLEEENK